MNKFNMIMFAVSVACGSSVMAQNLSKTDFTSGKDKIAADYTAARTGCTSLAGNANKICLIEAKGKEKVARAELDDNYKPSAKTHYQVLATRAEADYAVSREKCNALAVIAKGVCVKEAKATETNAKADATAQMKISNANATASETMKEARSEAASKVVDARKNAAEDKREAEYKVAKEKCETLSGSAMDSCLIQVKTRYSK